MIKKLGFTLLELLVVIGIISILVGVVSVSFSNAQKKARDVRRKSDMKAFQNCMEQAFPITNSYEVLNASGAITADCDGTSGTSSVTITDPINSIPHIYSVTSDGNTYTISVTLETDLSKAYTVKNLQ